MGGQSLLCLVWGVLRLLSRQALSVQGTGVLGGHAVAFRFDWLCPTGSGNCTPDWGDKGLLGIVCSS